MDNPERDLERDWAGTCFISYFLLFYYSFFCFYAVHNITLPVLPSLSLSPFPFPSFSQPLSLSLFLPFLPFLTTIPPT